jgi:hypothetical protein
MSDIGDIADKRMSDITDNCGATPRAIKYGRTYSNRANPPRGGDAKPPIC